MFFCFFFLSFSFFHVVVFFVNTETILQSNSLRKSLPNAHTRSGPNRDQNRNKTLYMFYCFSHYFSFFELVVKMLIIPHLSSTFSYRDSFLYSLWSLFILAFASLCLFLALVLQLFSHGDFRPELTFPL